MGSGCEFSGVGNDVFCSMPHALTPNFVRYFHNLSVTVASSQYHYNLPPVSISTAATQFANREDVSLSVENYTFKSFCFSTTYPDTKIFLMFSQFNYGDDSQLVLFVSCLGDFRL